MAVFYRDTWTYLWCGSIRQASLDTPIPRYDGRSAAETNVDNVQTLYVYPVPAGVLASMGNPRSRSASRPIELFKRHGQAVGAALFAFLIIALTTLGAVEGMWSWLRGVILSLGTLAGIYLGAQLQRLDGRTAIESAAEPAMGNLIALATSTRNILDTANAHRERPALPTIAAYQASDSAHLVAVDGQLRMLLNQAKAAAAAWEPYLTPEARERLAIGPDYEGESNDE